MNYVNIILIDTLNETPTNETRNIVSDSLGSTKFEVQDVNLLRINTAFFEQAQIIISNKKHTKLIIYLDKHIY
jgi:hypothetical protein